MDENYKLRITENYTSGKIERKVEESALLFLFSRHF
jgi:hypothetical protein